MKFKLATAAACTLFLTATSAIAQVPKAATSTAQLVAMCTKTTDVAAQNFCQGFSQGVYETYLITRHPKKAPNFICVEKSSLTRQDYINNFVTWSGSNPKFNELSASDTLLRYLGETYPCKKA